MTHEARAVAAKYPHLVMVRAKRGRKLFVRMNDGLAYLLHLRRACRSGRVRVLAWWLGTTRVYLAMVPGTKAGIAEALREAHRTYAKRINAEREKRGTVFDPHYGSCVVAWDRLAEAARFVEAGTLRTEPKLPPWRYLWSSARYNCRMRPLDPLVKRRTVRELVADWREFLVMPVPAEETRAIRKALASGRALGDRKFAARMGRSTQKRLRKEKTGPKPDPAPARRRPNYWYRLLRERPW